MSSRSIKTVNGVIDALGGTGAVAEMMSKKSQHVSNWRAVGRIASSTFLEFQDELDARNLKAPPMLWGIKEPKKKKRSA